MIFGNGPLTSLANLLPAPSPTIFASTGNLQNAALYRNIWRGPYLKRLDSFSGRLVMDALIPLIFLSKEPLGLCPLQIGVLCRKHCESLCTCWYFVDMLSLFEIRFHPPSITTWSFQMTPPPFWICCLLIIHLKRKRRHCGLSSSKFTFGSFGMRGIITSSKIENQI